MPRITAFFLGICLISLSHSQSVYSQKSKHLILKFAPLSLLDPYGPNYHFGIEVITKGNISVETDIAVFRTYNRGDLAVPKYVGNNGFKIKPEIRYYLYPKNREGVKNKGIYIANEVFFTKNRQVRGDTFIHFDQDTDTSYIYTDYDIIKRFEIGNNIKIGCQGIIKDRLVIDLFVGVGVKYYHTQYEYEVPDEICCHVIRFFQLPMGEGFRPRITFGIKAGIAL